MNQKVFALVGVCALLTANAYAQRPLKMAKQMTEAMTASSTRIIVILVRAIIFIL